MCTLPRNFPFLVLHLMQLFRVHLKLEVSIKGLQGVDSFVPLVVAGFLVGRHG